MVGGGSRAGVPGSGVPPGLLYGAVRGASGGGLPVALAGGADRPRREDHAAPGGLPGAPLLSHCPSPQLTHFHFPPDPVQHNEPVLPTWISHVTSTAECASLVTVLLIKLHKSFGILRVITFLYL